MFKPLDQVTTADSTHTFFSDPETLGPMTLEAHHRSIQAISVQPSAPREVIELFDRARNTLLYAWFSYDLCSVALSPIYAALELALRCRLGNRAEGLKGIQNLMEKALADGDLVVEDKQRALVQTSSIAGLRNIWMHGSASVADPNMALEVLEICAHIIGRLFPNPAWIPSRQNS